MAEGRKQENDDRRRYLRLPYNLRASIKAIQRDHVSPPENRVIEDLGAGGLSMRIANPLTHGQIVMLTLSIPPAGVHYKDEELAVLPESSCRRIEILSRVAWCSKGQDQDYLVGVQFLDLNLNDRIRLKDFLVTYQLDHPGSDLFT